MCVSTTRGDNGAMSCAFAATPDANTCGDRCNQQDGHCIANNRSRDNINVSRLTK